MNTRRLELAAVGAVAAVGLTEALLNAPEFGADKRKPAASPAVANRGTNGVPNVELQTHTGRKVRFYDDLVRGTLVVINMMYAGCNITCPPMTHNLVKVQELLGERVGRDIFMYSLTLKPEQDGPEDLAQFAKLHAVKPGWLFLTGRPAEVEQLRLALGFYDPDAAEDRKEGRHVGMVRIGNDPFKRWGMAPALAAPRQIVSMIEHLDRRHARNIG